MVTKKDDRLKVREIRTGEIFTFVEYVDNSRILVYDKNGCFKTLYMYDVVVII